MISKFFKDRKAGIPDGIFLVIGIFFVALVFLFVYMILSNVNDYIQGSSQVKADQKALMEAGTTKFPVLFDRLFAFIVVGLALGAIVGAWFINSHPALFWLTTPIMAFIIWLGSLFANIYAEIAGHQKLAAFSVDFPIMNFVFENFAIIITGFILLLALALFAKPQEK